MTARTAPAPATIDAPAYPSESAIRLIAVWHYGNDYRETEATAYGTAAALESLKLDMPAPWQNHAVYALGRPNDVHAMRVYDVWSWYRLVQVWARDTRPAREIIDAAIAADNDDRARWGELRRRCALSRAAHYAPDIAAILA